MASLPPCLWTDPHRSGLWVAAPGLRPRPLRTAPALRRSSGGLSAPSPPGHCPHLLTHTLSPQQVPPSLACPPGQAPPHLSVSTGTPHPCRPKSFMGGSSQDTGEHEEDGSTDRRHWPPATMCRASSRKAEDPQSMGPRTGCAGPSCCSAAQYCPPHLSQEGQCSWDRTTVLMSPLLGTKPQPPCRRHLLCHLP